MRETLKMMKSIVAGYESAKTIKELLIEYRQNQSPNILAYIFVSNYGLFEKFAEHYYMLDTQDIASFGLQELDKAMRIYDLNSNCKFITFFVSCFKNRLRSEQEALFHNVRFANYKTDSIDTVFNISDNFEFDVFDLDNYGFNNNEKQQIKLLLDGYSCKEIADMLNVSAVTIHNRNKNIGKKLLV